MKLNVKAGLPRLVAPGIPDWIGADGVRLAWTLRDALFVLEGDTVGVVPLPAEATDVAFAGEVWNVALPNGSVTVDPVAGQLVAALVDDEADPVDLVAGDAWVLFVETPSHRMLRHSDGTAVALPDAATRARFLRPWSLGAGACWVDFDTVYRMREDGRIAALGRAPGAEGIAVGPHGAVLVALKKDTVVAGPRGLTVRVGERVAAESARFAPDGARVLAATEDGAVLVDLASGEVVGRWEGHLVPVGFLPRGGTLAPVFLHPDDGAVRFDDGELVLAGFAGASVAAEGDVLAGPGGAAWSTRALARAVGTETDLTPARIRSGLTEGVCATDGRRIVQVYAAGFRVDDGPERTHGLRGGGTGDDALEEAWITGEVLHLRTCAGDERSFDLASGVPVEAGAPGIPAQEDTLPEGVRISDPDEASAIGVDGTTYPLPADGALRVEGDGPRVVLAWTDDGMLVALA